MSEVFISCTTYLIYMSQDNVVQLERLLVIGKTRTWRSQHSQGEESSLHLESKFLCNWSQDQRYNILNKKHPSKNSRLKVLVFKVFDSRIPTFCTSPSWLNCLQQTVARISDSSLDLVLITFPVLLGLQRLTGLERKRKALPPWKAKSMCDRLFHIVATWSDTVAGVGVLPVRH